MRTNAVAITLVCCLFFAALAGVSVGADCHGNCAGCECDCSDSCSHDCSNAAILVNIVKDCSQQGTTHLIGNEYVVAHTPASRDFEPPEATS